MPQKSAGDNGRFLRTVSDRYGERVSVAKLSEALDINPSTYYRRVKECDFPNAEECVRAARHFNLEAVNLLVTFGHLEEQEVEEAAFAQRRRRDGDGDDPFGRGSTATKTRAKAPSQTRTQARAPKLRDMTRNTSARTL